MKKERGNERPIYWETDSCNLMTPTEVGEMLKLSPKTLANWRYMKIGIPYIHIGKRVFYHKKDVEDFIKSCTKIEVVRL